MLEKLIEINNNIINETTNEEKKKKHILIKKILDDKECFLKMNIETSYALLRELNILEEDLQNTYLNLINPQKIIKKTLHKLINTNTYNNFDEFKKAYKEKEEKSLIYIDNWWGEGSYGSDKIIITNDKNIFRYSSGTKFINKQFISEYKSYSYEPLSDIEFNNIIDMIKNDLLNEPEESKLLLDGGYSICINYNGITKKFENMSDRKKFETIEKAIEELIVEK